MLEEMRAESREEAKRKRTKNLATGLKSNATASTKKTR